MFEMKKISSDAIPAALEKAVRYRLLNEPLEAESICLDVLELDPENQEALVTLLLAVTDQLEHHLTDRVRKAKEAINRLEDEFSRLYYEGIVCERQGKLRLRRGGPGSGHIAYDFLRQAMDLYERAAAVSPQGNDDAVLRWNTCARILMQHAELQPEPATPYSSMPLE